MRSYRASMGGAGRFRPFAVAVAESDLWIGVDPGSWVAAMPAFAQARVAALRAELEAHIARRPAFRDSLLPIEIEGEAQQNETPGAVCRAMYAACAAPRVGPFAAVAGALAEALGRAIVAEFGCEELVVENGGDIWALFRAPLRVPVFAGTSPLSGKVGYSLPPGLSPCAVCCSAGTFGPSLSFGRADAAVAVARDAALADAWATSLGNMVRVPADIEPALDAAFAREGAFARDGSLLAALLIAGDRMGARGDLPLELFA